VKLETARRQKEAVEAIIELGGRVVCRPQQAPKWLKGLFGEAYPGEVADVSLANYRYRLSLSGLIRPTGPPFPPGYPDREETFIRDADLAVLEPLSTLELLTINCREVTDLGLPHLQGLTSLKRLELTGTQVTPEGVKKLQEALPECEIVY
jgi:hypothetical protein